MVGVELKVLMLLGASLWGALVFWAKITLIVVILVGLLQWLRDIGWVERAARRGQRLARALRLSGESMLPLAVGVVFGLTYGGAVVVQAGREGVVGRRELWLVVAFLSLCHAIFEDTAIFAVMGAKWWAMLSTRVLMAVLLLLALERIGRPKEPEDDAPSVT